MSHPHFQLLLSGAGDIDWFNAKRQLLGVVMQQGGRLDVQVDLCCERGGFQRLEVVSSPGGAISHQPGRRTGEDSAQNHLGIRVARYIKWFITIFFMKLHILMYPAYQDKPDKSYGVSPCSQATLERVFEAGSKYDLTKAGTAVWGRVWCAF
jgi:hypothetical protein